MGYPLDIRLTLCLIWYRIMVGTAKTHIEILNWIAIINHHKRLCANNSSKTFRRLSLDFFSLFDTLLGKSRITIYIWFQYTGYTTRLHKTLE